MLSSNFELKIINFDLTVLSRGQTGAWIGVQWGSKPGFSDQNCPMLSIFEYRFCATDSSPVMADKKKTQCAFGQKCTYPGVNHAQDLYQSVISTIAVSCL